MHVYQLFLCPLHFWSCNKNLDPRRKLHITLLQNTLILVTFSLVYKWKLDLICEECSINDAALGFRFEPRIQVAAVCHLLVERRHICGLAAAGEELYVLIQAP